MLFYSACVSVVCFQDRRMQAYMCGELAVRQQLRVLLPPPPPAPGPQPFVCMLCCSESPADGIRRGGMQRGFDGGGR